MTGNITLSQSKQNIPLFGHLLAKIGPCRIVCILVRLYNILSISLSNFPQLSISFIRMNRFGWFLRSFLTSCSVTKLRFERSWKILESRPRIRLEKFEIILSLSGGISCR